MYLSNFFVFFTEDSNPEPDDPPDDTMDANKVPSASNQSTQTEDVVDLSKKPSEVEAITEEGEFNPSQDETDVWNQNCQHSFIVMTIFLLIVFFLLCLVIHLSLLYNCRIPCSENLKK